MCIRDRAKYAYDQLRSRGWTDETPVSYTHLDVYKRQVQEGGLLLLAKPVRPLALKSVLDRLLAGWSPNA